MGKDDNQVWAVLAVLGLILLMNNPATAPGTVSGATTTTTPTTSHATTTYHFTPFQTTPTTTLAEYSVTLTIFPSTASVGQGVTGTIHTNIPGPCTIQFNPNGLGWMLYQEVTPINGAYAQTVAIGTPGSAEFYVQCCDEYMICEQSNHATLTITP
jgi:hypothetical protein